MLISPAEKPQEIRELGRMSSTPEEYGADIYWISRHSGRCGIQRKEIADFVASVKQKGRLAREARKMQDLHRRWLVIEGRVRWSLDGQLIHPYAKWTYQQHVGVLSSLQLANIWVLISDNPHQTAELATYLEQWSNKDDHLSLLRVPNPKDAWGGAPTKQDWQVHLAGAICDGIGPKIGRYMIDEFGGIPITWDREKITGPEDFQRIKMVGKEKAKKLWDALEG